LPVTQLRVTIKPSDHRLYFEVTLKDEETAFSPSFLFAARLKPARRSTLNLFDPNAVIGATPDGWSRRTAVIADRNGGCCSRGKAAVQRTSTEEYRRGRYRHDHGQ
jgi:hypothetical protein